MKVITLLAMMIWAQLYHGASISKTCETDFDCPSPLVCRLLCKNTCSSVCIDLTFTRRKPVLQQGRITAGRLVEPALQPQVAGIFRDPPAFEPNAPAAPDESIAGIPDDGFPGPPSSEAPDFTVSQQVNPARGPPAVIPARTPFRIPPPPPPDFPNSRQDFSQNFNRPRPPVAPPQQLPKPGGVCPPPVLCGANCGVFIDENGCQGCQCMWISSLCSTDYDCRGDGQYCDFGRCECGRGYVQHPRRSGVCIRTPFVQRDAALTDNDSMNVRRKRSASAKPNREERLQWPGSDGGTV